MHGRRSITTSLQEIVASVPVTRKRRSNGAAIVAAAATATLEDFAMGRGFRLICSEYECFL